MNPLPEPKPSLRAAMRETLRTVSDARWSAGSIAACERVVGLPRFAVAQACMLFLPLPGEPTLSTVATILAHQGTTICAPRCDLQTRHMWPVAPDRSELGTTDFRELFSCGPSLRQPPPGWRTVPIEMLDLVLVPGLAFDRSAHRLGRGGGFYDRFLATPGLRAFKVGIAIDEQLIDKVPMESHDVPLDAVVTDSSVFPLSLFSL